MSSGLNIIAEKAKGVERMSKKKRLKQKDLVELFGEEEVHLFGEDGIGVREEDVKKLCQYENLIQGTVNGGFLIIDEQSEDGLDCSDEQSEDELDRSDRQPEDELDYPDEKSRILAAVATELIRIADEEREEEEICSLGRIISGKSPVNSYAEMLAELKYARTEDEINSIFEKYSTSSEVYPAAAEFAKVING